MPTMAEKFWEMAKSPPQQIMIVLFGLAALLTAAIARSMVSYVAGGTPVSFVAAVLAGVGAFFVTLGLFAGAYAGNESHQAWKIAQLIGAVIVLLFLL